MRPELVEIGGENVEGFVMTSHYHPQMVDSPEATAFVAGYQAEYARLPAGFEAVAFDSYNMMLRAIEDAGKPDPELMRDALEAMVDFPGVSGPITPGPSHNPKKSLALLKVENGELVYVYTAEPVD